MERRALSDEERLDWLQLIRSENVGPVTFHALIAKFGTASRALEAVPDLARNAKKPPRLAKRADCARERDQTYKYGARLIAACEPDYPEALAAIPDAPPVITIHGRIEALHDPCVGMVGARNASANGRRFASQLAAELGAAGLTIVSGLARGIDTAAHEGALKTGTVACIAGGIDHAYPPENATLMARIAAEGGCVVAEQPFGLKPTARHFPYRNRVISGLSRAVIVVEAALKSGSLITARLAAEQGRDVLAVPGSPLDPRSMGSNGLIRDGAALVASAADVLATLGPLDSPFEQKQIVSRLSRIGDSSPLHVKAEPQQALDSASASSDKILELLGFSPISVDELARQAHLSSAALSSALLELELAGRIERSPGGQISLLISKS
ncbi:MAG TPA: DNA-processing protein DprA [Alphaproteobacteria bacterium]|nr:DNA-processing protein DprA [Alphaproteobacteria bacterium]